MGKGGESEPFDYAWWSRACGVAACIINGIAFVVDISSLGTAFWCLFSCFIVACVELPQCCKCMDCCEKAVKIMSCMDAKLENPKGGFLRGVVYMTISIIGMALIKMDGVTALIAQIILVLSGFFYLVAFSKGFQQCCKKDSKNVNNASSSAGRSNGGDMSGDLPTAGATRVVEDDNPWNAKPSSNRGAEPVAEESDNPWA